MHDLVIRNGKVYDGLGNPPIAADVAIDDGKITAVGTVKDKGREEIDATGKLVTPGFVDIHTHYDGQVTWDPYLQPSTFHGVTTAVMGNCGVGFAPVQPDKHDWLIGLMEGVEDIPGAVLTEGIKWRWQSFPDFLDAVEASPLALDVGLQVPHGAVRAYVMGERASRLEPATPDETQQMAELVVEGLKAGALGFSTSRTVKHRDRRGDPTPSLKAEADELHGITRAMGDAGLGVIQLISDAFDFEPEWKLIRGMVEVSGRPLSITIEQDDRHPEVWQGMLDGITQAQKDGLPMRGQVPPRATGILQGLTGSLNPFMLHKTMRSIFQLPLDEKMALLKDPDFRAELLAEQPDYEPDSIPEMLCTAYHKMFALGDPPNYEPAPEDSVAAIAERQGRHPREVIIDMMLEDEGKALIYFPIFNYARGDLEDVRAMMTHPHTLFGLGDGGAHVGLLCDSSFPTTTLVHWGRDRSRGDKFPLEWLIQGLTSRNAQALGLLDRGALAPGMKADINVIDFNRLQLRAPEIVYDLPAGGKRLIQKADGYDATIVSGVIAFRNGQPTGALAGKLIRGPQPVPQGVELQAAE